MLPSPDGIPKPPEGCSFAAEGLDSSVIINQTHARTPLYKILSEGEAQEGGKPREVPGVGTCS